MKKLISIVGLLVVLTIGLCGGTSCTSSVKTNADSTEVSQQDSIQDNIQLDAEKVAACTSFITSFYQGLAEAEDEVAFVQQNLTPNAIQWLKDMFDYDCPDDNCMAIYRLSSDYTGDEGSRQDLLIQAVDNDTYNVTLVYDTPDGKNEYGLQFGLIQDGETYKIDAIEALFNKFDGKDQYAEE